jgi:Inner membrane protein YgaP-like, transmembrane domain
MKKNMGSMDKGIRIFLAVIIAILYFTNQITGVAAIILGIFAVVFLLTSFMSFCPLYVPFKLSTLKKSDKA